jgi:hypothetical protein
MAEWKIAEPNSEVMDAITSFKENLQILKHMDNKTYSLQEQKTLLEGKVWSLRREF